MMFNKQDNGKRKHMAKIGGDNKMEQMQRLVPESAKKHFNRKPYQVGGK